MELYRRLERRRLSDGETDLVASSATGVTNGPGDAEQIALSEPNLQPGNYVIRVVNFAAVEPYDGTINFAGPEPFQPAQTETWRLTCEFPAGNVLSPMTC